MYFSHYIIPEIEALRNLYTSEMMENKLREAGELIDLLKKTVLESDAGSGLPSLVENVCGKLNMPMLAGNPLFSRTIACLR